MSEKNLEVEPTKEPEVKADAPKNKAAKMSLDQAYAEIVGYKRVVVEKDRLITELTKQLDEANKVLESQEKGRLIGEILPLSQYKIDELLEKSTEELKSIRSTLDLAVPPKVNSVRFGMYGIDILDPRLSTVGDISWWTAQKLKGELPYAAGSN